MHSALLVAALVIPLVAALVTLAIPSGRTAPRAPKVPTSPTTTGVTEAEVSGKSGTDTGTPRRRLRRSSTGSPAGGVGRAQAVLAGPTAGDTADHTGSPTVDTIEQASAGVERSGEVVVASPERRGDPALVTDPGAEERANTLRRLVVRLAALTSAALWVGLTVLGSATAGPAVAAGAVAPALAAAALLLAAAGRPAGRLAAAATTLALGVAGVGLSLGGGGNGAVWVAVGLGGACLLVAVAGRATRDEPLGPPAVALFGAAAVVIGVVRVLATTGSLSVPAGGLTLDVGLLLAGGAAAVAVGATLGPRGPSALLLPVALAIGIFAAAGLGPSGDAVALALMVLALATTAGWAAATTRFPDARLLSTALALAALAAAAVSSSGIPGSGFALEAGTGAGVPAAWLLAAAAVVTAVSLVPLAGLSALPGASALIVVLVADPRPAHLALATLAVAGAAAAAGAVALSRASARDRADAAGGDDPWSLRGPALAAVPAMALGVWLLVAPATWTWVGTVDLVGWSDSVAVALAGGLIVAVAAGTAGRVALPRRIILAASDPIPGASTGAGRPLAWAGALILGLALLALLASV